MNLPKIFNFAKDDNINKNLADIKNKFNLYDNMPMPYCIVNKGVIIHANNLFLNQFTSTIGIKIKNLFKNLDISEGKQLIRHNKTSYNVNLKSIKRNGSQTIDDSFIIFFNESIYREKIENIVEQQMCVCYIILDNYEEAFESVEDIKVPVILAIIERRLSAFAQSLEGIIRKYEKDRYMLIFAREHLNYLKGNNFSIQSQIKDIDMGLKTPITISMGIGDNADNMSQLSDYAMSALELALGRGGDQVVIKSENEYEYFGESRQEASQNSRVKARVKAHAFAELILEYDNILIMGHVNPDLDCLGAAIGVYKIVSTVNAGATAKIVLGDKITTSISGLYNDIIKYKEYKDDVFIDNKKAISMCHDKTLVIIVDVYRGIITQCPELLTISPNIVVFDHHRKSSDHITDETLVYHNSAASSTSELITEMMMYIKSPIRLLSVEADALLAGITVDTKGFTFKTSSKTFDCASYLKNKGADSHNVHMFLQNDFDVYKSRSTAVNKSTVYKTTNAFAVVEDATDNPNLVVAQAADELLNLRNINSSFVLCKINDFIIVSLRSFGNVNVQLIAEQFGGGGHRTVAACKVFGMEVDELIELIKKELDKQIEEEA